MQNRRMIAVVIPFYQRNKGLLAKALRSIDAQEDVTDLQIFVVDDQSPVSAASEVAQLEQRPRFPLTVLVQPNGGPGAARNYALDALPDTVTHVAFLDSDDEWTPPHLARAMRALSAGHDVYFSNFYQLDQDVGAFERAGRIDYAQHAPIDKDSTLRRFDGDMLLQIMSGNLIGTSTVVYERRKYSRLRFREEFRRAGEDYLFWMDLAAQGARFCFSTEIEAVYGAGVNIYAGAGWGTEGHLERVQNEIRYRKMVLRLYPDTARKADLARKVAPLREAFIMDVLHRLRHRKKLPVRLLLQHMRTDPMTYVLFLPLCLKFLLRRT